MSESKGVGQNAAKTDNQNAILTGLLKTVDAAYSQGSRDLCARLVDDLYAYFDGVAAAGIRLVVIAGLTTIELGLVLA